MDIIYPILSFGGALLGAFLISYSRERGKNLATKEDVADITNRVESVKSVYNTEHEKLKAQLTHLVATKNSLHDDTKRAIFKFWEGTALLISYCDTTRDEVDEERIHELGQYKQELHAASNELLMHQARLYFLVHDKELLEMASLMVKYATRVQGKFELYMIRAQPHIEEMMKIHKSLLGTEEEYNAAWEQVQAHEATYDKEVEAFAREFDDVSEKFKLRAYKLLTQDN